MKFKLSEIQLSADYNN